MKRWLLVAFALFLLVGTGAPTLVRTDWHWRNPSPSVWLFGGVPLEATYMPTPIRSLQQISIVMTGVATNTQVPSPSVSLTSSVLDYQGTTSDDVNPMGCWSTAYGAITSAVLITATRGCATTNAVYNAVLVDYLTNFVKSRNCGTVAIGSGASSNTATITSVVPAKTFVALSGFINNDVSAVASASGNFLPRITLTNATTITATRQRNSTITLTAGYCYVEFK